MAIVFFYFNYFYAYALGGTGNAGLTEPFPSFSYYAIPFILIMIGWFNITTYISFGEKGKSIYYFVIALVPVAIGLAIIGIMQPGFGVSMGISIFFIGGFIFIVVYIFLGFFKETKK